MAAGNTYEAIATQTLGSATASVTFSSIPSTYTDLFLVFEGTCTSGVVGCVLRFNSDTSTNYSYTILSGDGSSVSSSRSSNQTTMQVGGMTSSSRSMMIANINNYSNATTYKTVLSRQASATLETRAYVGLWRSTAAITTVLVSTSTDTFVAGSTFSLYGIASA
jgi:hypothetical protein